MIGGVPDTNWPLVSDMQRSNRPTLGHGGRWTSAGEWPFSRSFRKAGRGGWGWLWRATEVKRNGVSGLRDDRRRACRSLLFTWEGREHYTEMGDWTGDPTGGEAVFSALAGRLGTGLLIVWPSACAKWRAGRCQRHRPDGMYVSALVSTRNGEWTKKGEVGVSGEAAAAEGANKSDLPVAERQSDAVLAPQMQSNVESWNEISRACRRKQASAEEG